MATAFAEELSKAPSKIEHMRRAKVLKKGYIYDASIDEDGRVRQALMYHQIWGCGKAVSYETAGTSPASCMRIRRRRGLRSRSPRGLGSR